MRPALTRRPGMTGTYAALLRPHNLADAMSAPSRIAASLSHTTGSITHSRLVKVPKPQSVEAITRSRSPTARHRLLDPARHDLRVLDEIDWWSRPRRE